MPIPKKITNFLDKHNIDHEILEHKTVYTAFDAAQTLGKKLNEIAKTLAVKADKKYIIIVVPASRKVNTEKLKKILGVKKVDMVKEVDIKKVFKSKPGALIPFAKMHKVPVYIDKALLKSKSIIMSSGSYTESLKVRANDLIEHGAEALVTFSKEHKFKVQKKQKAKRGGKKKAVARKTAKKSVAKKKKPVKRVVKK